MFSQIKQKIKKVAHKLIKTYVNHYGAEIVNREQLYDWQVLTATLPAYNQTSSTSISSDYLVSNNERLIALKNRYAKFDKAVTTPLIWDESIFSDLDIKYFRGDNAYVWQLRGKNMNELSYALTYYYLKNKDRLKLLDKLTEDEHFGNFTFTIDKKIVSRDLLDSVNEIYFLEDKLQISQNKMPILDIGAGYGRLASRAVPALDLKLYGCTDGVAFSSFICEYYLNYRKVFPEAMMVPLDKVRSYLKENNIQLAVNIHSFSECTLNTIHWWISLLSEYSVEYLFIIPNSGNHGGKLLKTNSGVDFESVLLEKGYKLVIKQPKYTDPLVQQYGINPTYYYLFKLS